ncbi:hypothetical protein ThrDRAFT_00706 [Frankia casuarinae]|nr:hypothetical protein CcI6DRAFT_00843 [Frankia sp. CcI6]EYT93644.1 hypothetical protein ThrDRAFT_00706 [Frankia casuarinae]KDA43865.1 hypothetical protein BMG523Draft_01247 [Frankia sp. BMG5.23]OAA27314.1 hypothetical protein AAY23_102477 [Frankia casuarinae]
MLEEQVWVAVGGPVVVAVSGVAVDHHVLRVGGF